MTGSTAALIVAAEVQHQMTRPFARYFIGEMQRRVVQAMIFSAAVRAIEAWEQGRPAYEGTGR